MSLRSLIEKLPYIAECQDADRFSKRNLMMFDYEIENPGSVFAYRESDVELNRLAPMEIPEEYIGNMKMYKKSVSRVKMAMLSQDKHKKRISERGLTELCTLYSGSMEDIHMDAVEAELTADQAVMDVWS